MEFTKLEILGATDDYRIALFRGTLVIKRFTTATDIESGILVAAGKLCTGVFVDGDCIYANISINGYDKLVIKYKALVHTYKDSVTRVRTHMETHVALGM